MVAIPKSFDIASGTKLRPQLTRNGIFVEDDDFFDFDEDILRDLDWLKKQGKLNHYLRKRLQENLVYEVYINLRVNKYVRKLN